MSKSETYRDVVIRVDQALKDLKDINASQHAEILLNVKELCSHVNHENELMCGRLDKLEEESLTNKAERKGQKKVIKILAGIAASLGGVVSALLTILSYLHRL